VRWARITRRLAAGRLEDALADVEHLEALATGARDKYGVFRRAGDAWKKAGLATESTRLYERALRYAPDDPAALAGLGAALVAEGRASRGAALLARAVELADAAGQPTSAMLLDLARVLADALGDAPAAVARIRSIPNDAPEGITARGLEGRWRAKLGDLAGASLAYARVRDLAESLEPTTAAVDAAVPLLLEAARHEETAQSDVLAAQRHLAAALRLRPKDDAIAQAYRAIGARVVGRPVVPEASAAAPPEDGNDEVRVEELTRTLQANPEDDAVVDELVARLSRLGRSLELFALLSARLEDAPPDRRERLLPRQRSVLERLVRDAREAGRTAEADLFADALARL
jgi:tetratricopeptide (TPR) repeat protein